jgi:3-oxoacyl-(acyl-carrier-protein) synthase
MVLAGGVDQLDSRFETVAAALGGSADLRGEGATLLVLEALDAARARGARILGVIRGAAWRALPARACGVGRSTGGRAITAALSEAHVAASDLEWTYASASGDRDRDAWEDRLLAATLGPARPAAATLGMSVGRHAGLGAMAVAAGAWTASAGRLPLTTVEGGVPHVSVVPVERGPGLVHAIARGGTEAALVVGTEIG